CARMGGLYSGYTYFDFW
nr:immunoglobulin heavy chain junction region [Macaca mulatta]